MPSYTKIAIRMADTFFSFIDFFRFKPLQSPYTFTPL